MDFIEFVNLFLAIIFILPLIIMVGRLSRDIFIKQQQTAKILEDMAGIQSITNFSEKISLSAEERRSFKSLAHILRENSPVKKLRILTLSGATSLLRSDEILLSLLKNGVDVDLMLLDPKSDNLFFEEFPRLLEDINLNLAKLVEIEENVTQGKLSIRFFRQPVFEMLTFIDDEQLFVSSFVPASTKSLIYEIRNGDKSLYNLYKPMFDFLWDNAEPVNRKI